MATKETIPPEILAALQPGDVCFYRGQTPTSRLIRLLTSTRYGIPYRTCLSHVDQYHTDGRTISAEATGVKLIPLAQQASRSDTWIWRFTGLQEPDLAEFLRLAAEDLAGNWPYAFARYILDPQRISLFYLAQLALLATAAGGIMKAAGTSWATAAIPLDAAMTLIAASLVIGRIARGKDEASRDCAEDVSQRLARWRKASWHGLGKPRNDFPNRIQAEMETLALHGEAELVAFKPAGGTWILAGGRTA